MVDTTYAFNDITVLIAHLKRKLNNATPLKIQKSLYFLWAFYSATYGNIDYSSETDFDSQPKYPEYLFKANFEAWKYGPVLNEVYHNNKDKKYENLEDSYIPNNETEKEILSFIDDLLSQVNDINDFSLVARSHEDSAWKKAYDPNGCHCQMDNETIKKDYIEYVKNQSEI